jgi:hypothetical protein
MSTNPSKECPFCFEKKTSHFLFKHILSQHADALFNEDTADGRLNRLHLKADGYKPLHLKAKEVDLYCCLECNAGSVRSAFAEKHWPSCRKAHTEKLKALAEKFPQTRPTFATRPTTDLSGVTITTSTTTTTTTIQAPNPVVLAYILRQVQLDVNVARAETTYQNKRIAKLAKRYKIPQEEIDDISAPTESDASDPEPDAPVKEKVEYDKEKKYVVLTEPVVKRYGSKVGWDKVEQEDVDTINLKGMKEKCPDLFK